MHRRLYAQLATVALLPALAGGCVQMTRHSNMMIFGTNTVVGIRAGVNATSVPEVAIGYTRQEAVVLPLVANVASVPAKTTTTTTHNVDGSTQTQTIAENGEQNRLEPCNLGVTPGGAPTPNGYFIHPCSLVGINGKALDSYSVLASFGGHFKGTSEKDKPEASASIAQYFATGVAAQTLALNGGASVVATGEAAAESAKKVPVPATITEITPTAEQIKQAGPVFAAYRTLRDALATRVAATTAADLAAHFAAFESAVFGTPQNLFSFCKEAKKCAGFVSGDAYLENYRANPERFETAVNDWK